MVTHSSFLAWRSPIDGGAWQSTIYRVANRNHRCNVVGFAAAQLVKNPPAIRRPGFNPWVGKIPWRRDQLPTPVFWSGEFHGLYSPWGPKELDMTEI